MLDDNTPSTVTVTDIATGHFALEPSPPDGRSHGDIMLRRVTIVLTLLTLVATGLLLLTLYICRYVPLSDSAPNLQVFTTRASLRTLQYAATSCALITALAGLVGLAVVRFRGAATTVLTLLSTIGALIMLPVLLGIYYYASFFECVMTDEIRLPDGRSYCMTASNYLIGDTLTIGRSGANYGLFRDMNALGSVGTDSPRQWATVIRPADIEDDAFGRLYANDSGLLVGMCTGCECYLIYDTRTATFHGFDDVEKTSPFVLIGPTTKMHQRDVDDLLQREKTHTEERPTSGFPTDETLTEALDHPNPAVRDLARQILDIRRNRETPANM